MKEYYALVADSDVFYVILMSDEHPIGEKWIAALASGLYFIKTNNYSQLKPGFFYKDGKFYDREDLELTMPLEEVPLENQNENKYAGIVDNDLIGLMTISKEEMSEFEFEMIDAGMLSNPQIVRFTDDINVMSIAPGWNYDGSKFYLEGSN
jgi:hypothetical protein